MNEFLRVAVLETAICSQMMSDRAVRALRRIGAKDWEQKLNRAANHTELNAGERLADIDARGWMKVARISEFARPMEEALGGRRQRQSLAGLSDAAVAFHHATGPWDRRKAQAEQYGDRLEQWLDLVDRMAKLEADSLLATMVHGNGPVDTDQVTGSDDSLSKFAKIVQTHIADALAVAGAATKPAASPDLLARRMDALEDLVSRSSSDIIELLRQRPTSMTSSSENSASETTPVQGLIFALGEEEPEPPRLVLDPELCQSLESDGAQCSNARRPLTGICRTHSENGPNQLNPHIDDPRFAAIAWFLERGPYDTILAVGLQSGRDVANIGRSPGQLAALLGTSEAIVQGHIDKQLPKELAAQLDKWVQRAIGLGDNDGEGEANE